MYLHRVNYLGQGEQALRWACPGQEQECSEQADTKECGTGYSVWRILYRLRTSFSEAVQLISSHINVWKKVLWSPGYFYQALSMCGLARVRKYMALPALAKKSFLHSSPLSPGPAFVAHLLLPSEVLGFQEQIRHIMTCRLGAVLSWSPLWKRALLSDMSTLIDVSDTPKVLSVLLVQIIYGDVTAFWQDFCSLRAVFLPRLKLGRKLRDTLSFRASNGPWSEPDMLPFYLFATNETEYT